MVAESHDTEEDGKEDETHELNGLAANGVAKSHGNPVTWNCAGAD